MNMYRPACPGTDPEDLKGGWLDTVAKGTAAEIGNGPLWNL